MLQTVKQRPSGKRDVSLFISHGPGCSRNYSEQTKISTRMGGDDQNHRYRSSCSKYILEAPYVAERLLNSLSNHSVVYLNCPSKKREKKDKKRKKAMVFQSQPLRSLPKIARFGLFTPFWVM